jgi:hypothetical protein
LEVLDNGNLEDVIVGIVLDDRRHSFKFRYLGGSQASLSGDKLIPVALAPNDEGLNNSVRPDGNRQLMNSCVIKHGARLQWIRVDILDAKVRYDRARLICE